MAGPIPDSLFPIVVVQDRYFGLYSGGAWFAIANADTPFGPTDPEPTRIAYCIDEGPNGTDEEAVAFWSDPPKWVAVGVDAETALRALILRTIQTVKD